MLKEEHIDLEDEVAAGITEYRVPDRRRMKRQRQAYEEAEREGRVYGGSKDSHHTGAGQDILQL